MTPRPRLSALLLLLAALGARAQLPTFPNTLILAQAQAPATPSSAPSGDYAEDRARLFRDFSRAHPREVWKTDLSSATRQAVRDFQSGKRLGWPLLLTYGQSVKRLQLARRTAGDIDATLRAKGFQRFDDWVRNPKTHQPKARKDGRFIPMIVYVHPDGGMIRLKPEGDPTDRFRPQPDVVVAVRFPADADYRDFDKEGFKVDAEGRALPKWPRDLYNPYAGTPRAGAFTDGWGDATHLPVASSIPSATGR